MGILIVRMYNIYYGCYIYVIYAYYVSICIYYACNYIHVILEYLGQITIINIIYLKVYGMYIIHIDRNGLRERIYNIYTEIQIKKKKTMIKK